MTSVTRTPDRDGVWLRTWTGRDGRLKRRVFVVRDRGTADARALELRRGAWRPLTWWDGLPGDWAWVQEDASR